MPCRGRPSGARAGYHGDNPGTLNQVIYGYQPGQVGSWTTRQLAAPPAPSSTVSYPSWPSHPAGCMRFGVGCTGGRPPGPGAPGGGLRFLAGIGNSLLSTVGSGLCMVNVMQCAQNMATGSTCSAKYTNWTAGPGHRIVEPGTIEVAVGGASDSLPLSGSFTLTGSERALGAGWVLDTLVAIREIPGKPGKPRFNKGRKFSRHSRRQTIPAQKSDSTANSPLIRLCPVDSGF